MFLNSWPFHLMSPLTSNSLAKKHAQTYNILSECHQAKLTIDLPNYQYQPPIHHQHYPGCVCCNEESKPRQGVSRMTEASQTFMRGYRATVQQSFWDKHPRVQCSQSQSMELKFITHFSAERRQLIFLPLLWSLNSPPLELHYTCLFTWLLAQGKVGRGVCWCVSVFVCVVSQWAELEVIIMYRSVYCNAHANTFSVATAQVPMLR